MNIYLSFPLPIFNQTVLGSYKANLSYYIANGSL